MRNSLTGNARMGALQVVVTSGTLLLLYRAIVHVLGIEAMGIWSIVLATVAASRLADFGIPTSLTRFVATAVGQDDRARAVRYVQTGTLALGGALGVIAVLALPLVSLLVGRVVPEVQRSRALSVVPLAVASAWVNVVAAVIQGSLDGTHRIDLRARLNMVGSVLLLVAALVLMPRFNLLGLAYAQLLQAMFLLLGGWVLLRGQLPLPMVPHAFDVRLLREILAYSGRLQLISFLVLLWEPASKLMLARWGGLAATGYFEGASRMVQQVRGVIISVNQTLVPSIADAVVSGRRQVADIYRRSYAIILFLAFPVFGALVAAIPVASLLWLGRAEPMFITFATLLSAGWLANVMSGPAYYLGIGTGELRWNIIGHVTLAAANLGLGVALGIHWGAIGVVAASAAALVVGAAVTTLGQHRALQHPLSELLDPPTLRLALASLAGAAAGSAACLFAAPRTGWWGAAVLDAVAVSAFVLPAVVRHPLFAEVRRRIF